jgi:3-methyladenine DNA glycosylase AlkD
MTPLAAALLSELQRAYRSAADPARAASMRAYMRDQFPYLGIPGPKQAELTRAVLAAVPAARKPTQADLTEVSLGCWALDEREFAYFPLSYLRRHVKACDASFIDTVRTLVTTKSWWDTVDALAARVAGPLVQAHPALIATMDAWLAADNMWLNRVAILHQLHFKSATDQSRLFRYCESQAGHKDFFIRKAIGWALREYGKTAPDAVRGFVKANRDKLSGLSTREALKNLGPQ